MFIDDEVESAERRPCWRPPLAVGRVTLAAVVGAGLGLAVAGVLVLAGCGSDGGVGAGCDARPGDVRLTELMIDPPGDGGSGEWIELLNPTDGDVVLDRARLVVEATRRGEWELHVGAVAGGARLVVGGGSGAGASARSYVSWGKALELANTGARVSLACGEVVIDAVSFGSAGGAAAPAQGHSLSREEAGEGWCAGVTPFGEGLFGTPGEANPPCGRDSCSAGGTVRPVVALGESEMVVSEVYAGGAGDGDWVELLHVGARVVDLNGVALEATNESTGKLVGRWVVDAASCSSVAPGEYVVLGAAQASGPVVDVLLPGLALPAHVPLELRLVSADRVVDRARVPAAPVDASVRLDQARLTAGADADRASYCEAGADQTGWFAGRGTPGRPNGSCGTFTCMEAGAARATRPPGQGALVVTEVFARSALSAITGGGRDWLELYGGGVAPVDLNGVTVVVESADTGAAVEVDLAPERCVAVDPGAHVVIAASTDPALTGGVPAVVGAPGLSIFNDAPLVITVRHGETVIDVARVPPGVSGRSQSLGATPIDAAANDAPGAFCVSQVTGLFDEGGTPGRPNVCGPVCRDGDVRALRRPRPGDLVITEVFPDPTGADAGRDWIEVRALAGVDLAGVVVAFESPGIPPGTGSKGAWSVRDPAGGDGCLPAPAGAHVVIGGVAAASLGAPPLAVFGGSGEALLPSNPAVPGDVQVRLLADGAVVAEAAYPQSDDADPLRRLVAGKSWAVDETSQMAGLFPATWCTARTRGPGFGDVAGTPGALNPDVCP
jgi:hypothetical protein